MALKMTYTSDQMGEMVDCYIKISAIAVNGVVTTPTVTVLYYRSKTIHDLGEDRYFLSKHIH